MSGEQNGGKGTGCADSLPPDTSPGGESESNAERFLRAFSHWASTQPDLSAAALVGSHARGTATDSSDVDLVLVVHRPGRYLDDTTWTDQFGCVLRRQVEDYGLVTSLRVWYAGGLEVEYGLTDERWVALPLDEGTQQVIADGMHVLWERSPVLSRLV